MSALLEGYSSDEDNGPLSTTTDVFSLSSLPATKKIRVDEPSGSKSTLDVIPQPQAAPDVLAEVCQSCSPLYGFELSHLSLLGSPKPNLTNYTTDGHTNEREHPIL